MLMPGGGSCHKQRAALTHAHHQLRGQPFITPRRTAKLHQRRCSSRAARCSLGQQQAQQQQTSESVGGKLRNKEEGQSLTEAVDALEQLVMQQGSSGRHIPNSTFYNVLKRCSGVEKNMALGRRVHALAVQAGYEADAFLANHLICMYAGHGDLQAASQVFAAVPSPNRFVWASIILAHARRGQPGQAIALYTRMTGESAAGVQPDDHVFVAVLKACGAAGDLEAGRKVHADIVRSSAVSTVVVRNCLVEMYAKCGSLDDARRVFDGTPARARTAVTWNHMLAGYVQHGDPQAALALYASSTTTEQEGGDGGGVAMAMANQVTFVLLLRACAAAGAAGGAGALQQGHQLHAHIRARGLDATDDAVLGTCLVDMYAKCGAPAAARAVFDSIPRARRDVVAWTAMIAGYARAGRGRAALALYAAMTQANPVVVANRVTLLCVLQACGAAGDLGHGKRVHAQLRDHGMLMSSDAAALGNALVDMYAKCGSVEDAREVFDGLLVRDAVTWTSLMAAYVRRGRPGDALALHATMLEQQREPDAVTLVCLLQACGSVAALDKGRRVHAQLAAHMMMMADEVPAATSARERERVFVANALIDMYGKCGSMADAQHVFDAVPAAARDVVSWNALMAGYTRHGATARVFALAHQMLCRRRRQRQSEDPEEDGDGDDGPPPPPPPPPPPHPDRVTFLCVLTACSHAGLVEPGRRWFARMMAAAAAAADPDHGVAPDLAHYTCMVDLLGRAGRVEDAVALATAMPVPPDAAVWCSVLGACRKWAPNVRLARLAFQRAVELDATDPAPYVLLAGVYAGAGMPGAARAVRAMGERAAGVVQQRRQAGRCGWADAGGRVYAFGAGGGEVEEEDRRGDGGGVDPEWRQRVDAHLRVLSVLLATE